MTEYKASIEYTPNNMKKLGAIIDNTFHFGIKVGYCLICLALIFYACSIGFETPSGMIGIALGCLLLPSVNAFEHQRTNTAIRNMRGEILRVNYTFQDKSFFCVTEKERNEFQYNGIIRLVKTQDFLYMFPNRKQAYMIDISSIQPVGTEMFKAFISRKTDLQWTSKLSLLSLNIRVFRFIRDNTRKGQGLIL